MEDVKEWLSVAEVAEKIGVSKQLVTHWIRAEGLPAYSLGGWRIKPSDLAKWLETRKSG